MDAVLRNFKLIPCPAGDACTTKACQWQHTWDIKPPPPQQTEDAQDEDGPRKRRKVASEPASIPARSVPRKIPQPASELVAIGTPPKRPLSLVTPQQPKPQKATPRKPETLNPRHLKSAAPAAHDFRYKALKLLHDQFQRLNNELKKDAKEDEKKLVLSTQELIWFALDEEQRMATDKPSIYQNIIKNHIMAYKRMTPGQWRDERLAESKKKEARASTSKTSTKSILGPPKVIKTGLTPQQEVELLAHLHTPIDSLAKWGYVPIPPTEEEIAKAREGVEASLGWEGCDRCSTRFQVFPGRREEDGALTSGGKCVHHPGRPYYPDRAPGSIDRSARRYRCCQQEISESAGCVTGDTHVFKTTSAVRLATVIPFVETPPNPDVPNDRAVCFDCEMGYTARGMELIRLTATSWPGGEELLDVLVRPVGEILDLNSRYSGVWPEDMVNAEQWTADTPPPITTASQDPPPENNPPNPQTPNPANTLKIVPPPPPEPPLLLRRSLHPLIGHGLENDSTQSASSTPPHRHHPPIPHPRGLPMRYGLKMLAERHLNKAIQIDTGMGHDSGEDARAAGS
ncbi:RNA exonuclease 3 [Collariella sp. IMI 366227]|nr:RNA exonuclease 3 [Collariella sp. IMI 366227]